MSSGFISLGSWGSRSGGEPWSYKPTSGISEIIIHEGGNIKSISFKDAGGFISGTFGGRNPDPAAWGEQRKITVHWPSEYLRSISGTYGTFHGLSVITSLSFDTNLTKHGTFGTADGEPFSVSIADGVVVGFHGRSGYYVDAIGIYVKPVNPEGSISFGQWGGLGGDPFNFTVENSWIKQITVREGLNIKSLSFKDGNDHHYGTFGGKNPTDTGEEKIVEFDGQSEFLTCISGTSGSFAFLEPLITSLSFITNLNTYGPFGKETGTPFSLPIQGGVVVGFHGRSGHYLDAIGIYVKPRGLNIGSD